MNKQPTDNRAYSSAKYWRRIFANNPRSSSWQEPKQLDALGQIQARLRNGVRPMRVLDYGIGNLGLYHCFNDEVLEAMLLTGISESEQHDPDDELIKRFGADVIVGAGLSPLQEIPVESQNYVISTYVFAYLDEHQRAKLVEEFARVLVPGGELILVLHHPHSRRYRNFRKSAPYWLSASRLYDVLLGARYEEAHRILAILRTYLD